MDKTDRGAAFDEAIATLNDGTAALGGTVVEVVVHDTLEEAVADLQKAGMTRSAAMSPAARAIPSLSRSTTPPATRRAPRPPSRAR